MSGLLLDSHTFHWYDTGDSRLRPDVVTYINVSDPVFVSAASIWELTIKRVSGNFQVTGPLLDVAEAHGFQLLAVSAEHAKAIASLPRLHGDPFDHILLAQARIEKLTLVTHDDILARYGVPVLLV